MIDEKKLIEEIKKMFVSLTTADGSAEVDVCIHSYDEALYDVLNIIQELPIEDEWIPVEEQMPEEHDSGFAKYKGTSRWLPGMFEKCSDEVEVTFELTNDAAEEKRIVRTSHTNDGKWSIEKELGFCDEKVIAWRPLGEPYQGEEKTK